MNRHPQYIKILLVLPLLLTLALPIFLGQRPAAPAALAVPPGIEYTQRRNGEVPWSIHVVRVDRAAREFKFAATVAQGTVLGLSSVSEQMRSLGGHGWSPAAAVNGDFFRIENGPYQGDMLGLQITSGTLISSPSGPAFWIGRDGSYRIGQVSSRIEVMWPGANMILSAGLNGPRTEGRAVLYTPEFGARTQTDDKGIELVLEPAGGGAAPSLAPSLEAYLRIAKIHEDGNNDVRPGTVVLSIESKLAAKLPKPEKNLVMHVTVRTTPDLAGVTTAIGGGPVLVHEGKINPDAAQATRHPRTAIGFNDRYFYMVVVDGRQPKLSMGMTMPELARYMADLGATEALNLDGGGSSEMWIDGQVVNSPSDGRERPVANALAVLARDPKP